MHSSSLCFVEAGESGSEFSPFSMNTNTMQLDTSPLTFPSQFSSFGKGWDTKELDHYSLKWIDGVLKKSQK